jgi:hypothetical protein
MIRKPMSLLFHPVRRKATALIAMAVIVFTQSAPDASAANYTWTQTAGGSQNWTTGGNWQGGSAPSPASGDTVDFSTVDILANTTVTLGANRTATTWKFGDTSGAQTWTVSGNTLILAGSGAGIEVGTATSISSVFSVSNGTTATATGNGPLTLTNSSFSLGGTTTDTTQTLDLTGLAGGFTYNNSSGTFRVSGTSTTTSGNSTGTIYLAPSSTITATTFGVGNSSGNANSGTAPQLNFGTVYLGSTATTINADTIILGAGKSQGTVQYASGGGATNPELTLRGADGTSRVTTMIIGTHDKDANPTVNTWDLTSNVSGTSQLDAMIGTLVVGESSRTSTSGTSASVTGNFLMGGGTLDATSIVLGRTVTNTRMLNTTGTFTTGAGGTVKVGTLTIGDKNATENKTVTATFNLNGGANLHATTIQAGNTAANGSVTRTFNWNDGTIHNLAGTDLTIGTGVTWILAAAGTRTFDIENGRTGTVNAVLAGTGGTLTKTGEGTLTLNGTHSYSGTTSVIAGTLVVDGNISTSSLTTIGNGTDAATLQGSGTVGALTIAANASHNPGNNPGNSPGIMNTGDYTMNGTLNIEITGLTPGITGHDQVIVEGTVNLSGSLVTAFSGGSYVNGDMIFILLNDGIDPIVGTFAGLAQGDTVTNYGGFDWQISYLGDSTGGTFTGGNDVVLMAVPEPAAAILGCLGMVLLLRRRRA